MNAREVSDRLEIEQVLHRYFQAMDSKDYGLLDGVFSKGAVVRYESLAGLETTYEEMIPSFVKFNRNFRLLHHMGGQLLIDLDGDRAVSHINLRAVHVQETHEGEENQWVIYGRYRDLLERTQAGWRIRERHFVQLHTEGELLPFERCRRFPGPTEGGAAG